MSTFIDMVETKTIDTEALIKAVRAVAAEKPDYRYDIDEQGQCTYQRHGKPDCIVGQGLARIGVPVSDLAAFDACGDTPRPAASEGILSADIDTILTRAYGLSRYDEDVRWLSLVQQNQDSGQTFGEAVRNADAGEWQ